MNALQRFEQEQIAKLTEGKNIPDFRPGDSVRVSVKIVEGNKERIQAFEGVCIARRNASVNSAFTLRKVTNGEGVERVFPLYSPNLAKIEVVKRGIVRRAKLYYMRKLFGKAARIQERKEFVTQGSGKEKVKTVENKKEEKPKAKKTEDSNPKVEEKKVEAKTEKKETSTKEDKVENKS